MASSDNDSSTEKKPVKWEDLIPPANDNTTTWDFTTFLTAPAVKSRSGSENKVKLVNIPRTKIPSPLATNLSPRQVQDVKEFLVGKDGSSGSGGNGREIWLSWKRAWDIWNNYYIEGRVNPIWIREDWEERELHRKNWDKGRDNRRRERERRKTAAAGGHPPLDPNHNPLLPKDQLPKSKPFHEKNGIHIPTDLGSKSTVSKAVSKKPKFWGPGDPFFDKVPVDPQDPDTHPWPAPERQKWITVQVKSSPGSATWLLVHDFYFGTPPASPKKSKKAAVEDVKDEDDPTATAPPPKNKPVVEATPEQKKKPVEEAAPGPKETTPEETQGEDEDMLDIDDGCVLETIIDDAESESESDSEPPPAPPRIDGWSGGYKPLKVIEEFEEPYGDKDDGKVWEDNVTNTVWAPRRVGEKTLKIELDDDMEDFCKKSELKVDGGVDCTRSPFPLLRRLTEYVRTLEGAFRKKKAWDGVTGTLFNLPTQPLEPCTETADDKKQLIKDMYRDHIRDIQNGKSSKILPLDIRRVLKVAPGLDMPKDICGPGETRVRDPALYPDKEYREMNSNDPWYVTDAQKMARDTPPRRHPPKQEELSGKHLPLDDQLWKEERSRDLNHNTGYFVTNLHGGTLIVNGMEIKKGEVAGPLPEFAIIENPGGQVAFWWGIDGRHYGERNPDRDNSGKWDILRRREAWEHAAKSAGEVWDAKIRHRKEREKTGENEDDDDQWAAWKSAEPAKNRPADGKPDGPLQPGRYGPIPPFSRDDGTGELKWLNVQEEEKIVMLRGGQHAFSLNIPDEGSHWPGTASASKLSHEFTRAEINGRWRIKQAAQLRVQKALNETVAQAEANIRVANLETEKRKAEEELQSDRKRMKIFRETLEREAADEANRLKRLKDAENTWKLEALLKKEESDKSARIARLMKENDGLTKQEALTAYEEWQTREREILEKKRVQVNKDRKARGLPELPPSDLVQLAAFKGVARKDVEEAKERNEERTEEDAIKEEQETDEADERVRLQAEADERKRLQKEADERLRALARLQDERVKEEARTREHLERAAAEEARRVAENKQREEDAAEKARRDKDKASVDELQRETEAAEQQAKEALEKVRRLQAARAQAIREERERKERDEQARQQAEVEKTEQEEQARRQALAQKALREDQALKQAEVEKAEREERARLQAELDEVQREVEKANQRAKVTADRARQEKAKKEAQAQRDADEADRLAKVAAAQDKAKKDAREEEKKKQRQKKAAADSLSASQNLQTQWDSVLAQFKRQQNGTPAQLQAAQKVLDFQDLTGKTEEYIQKYTVWQKSQTPTQFTAHDNARGSASYAIVLAKEAASTSRVLQTQWNAIINQFNRQKKGTPSQLQAAQNLINYHVLPFQHSTESNRLNWQRGQTPKETTDQANALEAAHDVIKTDKEAKAKANPNLSTKPPTTSTGTTELTTQYPSILDKELQAALEKAELGEDKAMKTLVEHRKVFLEQARVSLHERAASNNMTIEAYIKNEGYASEGAYLEHRKRQIEEEERTRPGPNFVDIRGEANKREAHLELYAEDMKDAIREGMRVRAEEKGIASLEAYAIDVGRPSLNFYVEEMFEKQNLTYDDLPPRNDLNKAARYAWIQRLNRLRHWEKRIGLLPKGPEWSTKKKEWDAYLDKWRIYCDL